MRMRGRAKWRVSTLPRETSDSPPLPSLHEATFLLFTVPLRLSRASCHLCIYHHLFGRQAVLYAMSAHCHYPELEGGSGSEPLGELGLEGLEVEILVFSTRPIGLKFFT